MNGNDKGGNKLINRLAIEDGLMKEMGGCFNSLSENNQEIFLIKILGKKDPESLDRIFNSVE